MAPPETEPTSFRFKVIDAIAGVLHRLGPWLFIFLIVREAATVLIAYAGKQTLADVGFRFLLDFRHLDKLLSYLLAVGGVSYGYRQKRLREKNIGRLAPESQERERQSDPARTSSRLTSRGRTRREDRP